MGSQPRVEGESTSSVAPDQARPTLRPVPRRQTWMVIPTVAVAAVVVVSILALGGWLGHRPAPGASSWLTFSQANAAGLQLAQTMPGDWKLASATGLEAPYPLAVPSYRLGFCTLPAAAVPSSGGSPGLGYSAYWNFLYNDSSPTAATWLWVTVVGGVATIAATLHSNCAPRALWGYPVNATGILDSPAAVAAAVAAGGGTYLQSEPNATIELTLDAWFGGSPTNPTWLVWFDPCGAVGLGGGRVTGTFPTFSVTLSAHNGTALMTTPGNDTCSAASSA